MYKFSLKAKDGNEYWVRGKYLEAVEEKFKQMISDERVLTQTMIVEEKEGGDVAVYPQQTGG